MLYSQDYISSKLQDLGFSKSNSLSTDFIQYDFIVIYNYDKLSLQLLVNKYETYIDTNDIKTALILLSPFFQCPYQIFLRHHEMENIFQNNDISYINNLIKIEVEKKSDLINRRFYIQYKQNKAFLNKFWISIKDDNTRELIKDMNTIIDRAINTYNNN